MANLSPMMKQYFEIKEKYKDYILFFRVGDFYEMFFDDAKLVSKELELTLTGKECGLDERAPMCGIPYHSYESYMVKLINKGFKVAICEQMDSTDFKGIVRRDVVRVVTPGTIVEGNLLHDDKNNFIAALYIGQKDFGVCFCDVSTGEIFITDIIGNEEGQERKLINELSSFLPCEIIANQQLSKLSQVKRFVNTKLECLVNLVSDDFDEVNEIKKILSYFGKKSLEDLGFDNCDLNSVKALSILIKYLKFTYKSSVNNISYLNFYKNSQYMALDLSAKKNLEITENIKTKDKRKSLLGVLDKTKTPMGKRMIKKFLDQPLINIVNINKRLDAVEELYNNSIMRMSLTEAFSGIFDIERLLTKIIFQSINPRELQSFKFTIGNIKNVKEALKDSKSSLLQQLCSDIDLLEDIYTLINDSINDSPPVLVRDGEIIKDGYNIKIDEYRSILKNSQKYISKIESKERENTAIKNLKVGYNKVFGYYIEVSKSFLSKVPEYYIRKQTLANCERYIIEELKDIEYKILQASEKVVALEGELYQQIISSIADHIMRIQRTAVAISNLDVLCSFANVSVKNNYVKPVIDNSDVINIKNGRHPIVESILQETPFVSNNTSIDLNSNKISIITGPNMAGKSTYMRQVALIVIMAQIGCFVPATSAHIGVVDGIYTRIGSSDDLSSGQSTFMIEMNEIAYILKNMTCKSLVILDELGRGTSTYDGMSIAQAIIEYIASDISKGGKTLFATHYHELAKMQSNFNNIKNYSVAVKKNGEDIVFLHRIIPDSCDKSYGLEVSKLAGIPSEIITRAREILNQLESNKLINVENNLSQANSREVVDEDISNSVLNELSKIDPDVLSPLEALNCVFKLKLLADKKNNNNKNSL